VLLNVNGRTSLTSINDTAEGSVSMFVPYVPVQPMLGIRVRPS